MAASRPKGSPKVAGRKKGTPNKTTASVKQALLAAFDHLGGIPSLVKWGKENPTEFYRLWSKLVPQEIKSELSGPNGKPIEVKDGGTPSGVVGQIGILGAAILSAASREQSGAPPANDLPKPVHP